MGEKFKLDDLSLIKAKRLLKDIETNIEGDRKNLCLSCNHFNPTKVTGRIKINKDEGFGGIGKCSIGHKLDHDITELNIPVWKCEDREKEIRDVIKEIEESIIKAVGDDIPTAKQFINYKESVNKKLNFVVMVLYIIIAVTAIVGIKLHLEIKEIENNQKSGVQNGKRNGEL